MGFIPTKQSASRSRMAAPYTYIQCPCSDPSTDRAGDGNQPLRGDAEDDDRTFDPRAPRSNYSLYPLEYLMYCEDCQEIRCPRCVNEEIVTYYCPNCLFEVPSSNIKSEGNRYVLARSQTRNQHSPRIDAHAVASSVRSASVPSR